MYVCVHWVIVLECMIYPVAHVYTGFCYTNILVKPDELEIHLHQ